MTPRVVSLMRKSARQQSRDILSLVLLLLTAPLFVVSYWAFLGGASSRVACVCTPATHVGLQSSFEERGLELVRFYEINEALRALERDRVDAVFVPSAEAPKMYGDAGTILRVLQSIDSPYSFPDVQQASKTFDRYIPGLIVFAIIMLVFSAAMAVARECETGTIQRLRLAGVHAWHLLLGLSGVQLVLGVISVWLTLGTAILLGFRVTGSLFAVFVVSTLGCVASLAMGVMVASLVRTVQRAFLASSVVMFLLLLFSGLFFPQPRFAAFDLLPTAQVQRAFVSLMVQGQSLGEVWEHVWALAVVSVVLLVMSAVLFRRVERA